MELERLWIERFHGERELAIDFAAGHVSSPILRFLVGPNGAGKSRVLEALARIFSHLASGLGPEIGFELRYAIDARSIVLTTREQTVRELLGDRVTVAPLERVNLWLLVRESHDEPWAAVPRWPSSTEGLLPRRVVTLSSGPVSRFAWAVVHSREDRLRREMAQRLAEPPPDGEVGAWERQRRQLLDDLEADLRDLWDGSIALEVQPEDALLAILAVLAHPAGGEAALRESLLERTRLAPDRPIVAFVVDVAHEWRALVPELQRATLERLSALAARRIVLARPAQPEERGEERAPDEAWVFAADGPLGEQLRIVARTPQVLFEQLLTYKRRGAIRRVQLLLAKRDGEEPVLDEELSDGEFLLLGRYCTLTLLRGQPDCLVLLDEPETHFNDEWKVCLVRDLEELLGVGGSRRANEVLIATHSDLTLTDAERQDVYVFDPPHGGDGVLRPEPPAVSPLAADRGTISRSLFNVEEGIGARARTIVEDALESRDREVVEATVGRLGPGFPRFRVAHRLRELMSEDDGDAA